MIVSAISLWRKYDLTTPLSTSEWMIEERNGVRYSHVAFSGHAVEDGTVRIYARWMYPLSQPKAPAVLLLNDVGKAADESLAKYFLDKGYAVLMPDYSGKTEEETDASLRTVYPSSLAYANLSQVRGLSDMEGIDSPEKTCWFEWTYVALYAIEFLKSQPNVGNIGIVGVRTGGDVAWQALLSPDVKCGVPINAVGWKSFSGVAKFGDESLRNLSDEQHRYIAAVEAQSYAPYVKCPVLMLCALRDRCYDCDRAYDTYSRIGNEDGNALLYSSTSGACIGPHSLVDMDLFLEKNLKGREIYIPAPLNMSLKETDEGEVEIEITFDEEGILESAGIFYAEADVNTRCAYRDWRFVKRFEGKSIKDGKVSYKIKPFEGASAIFVYAYAKYINGFRTMSKITCKRLTPNANAVKGRMLFCGKEMDSFSVAEYKRYALGEIFLEETATPKKVTGYGGIQGAFSVGGIKTYKISSPMYVPDENALLEFDVYFKETDALSVSVDVGEVGKDFERYTCSFTVKGGGKWKRIVMKAGDFKGENSGMQLKNFSDGRALIFDCKNREREYAVTNILWL